MDSPIQRANSIFAAALAGAVLATGSLLGAGASGLAAQEKTPITQKSFSAVASPSSVDLMAGGSARPDQFTAGVKIKLKPGWKTYWRTPGQSGIPPSFDWSGSTNVASAEVQFPAPRRFSANGETVYGYHDEVIFPVVITPERADEPVKLKLSLFYAVCRDICMPVQADATTELGEGLAQRGGAGEIERFERLVPKQAVAGLDIARAQITDQDEKESLEVVIRTDDAAGAVDLFVESEAPGVMFGAPMLVASNDGERVYRISVDKGRRGHSMRGTDIELTVVQGEKALARKVKVN